MKFIEIHLYIEEGRQIVPRLHDEFFAALRLLERRAVAELLMNQVSYPSLNLINK